MELDSKVMEESYNREDAVPFCPVGGEIGTKDCSIAGGNVVSSVCTHCPSKGGVHSRMNSEKE